MIRLLKPLEYYEKNTGHGCTDSISFICLWRNNTTEDKRRAGLACVKLQANREKNTCSGKELWEQAPLPKIFRGRTF